MAAITDPFTGVERFAAPPERVFAVLSDLDALARAVPGSVSAQRLEDGSVRCVVKPGLSFIGGSVKATLAIAEATPPTHVLLRIASTGIGMTLNLAATMSIAPDGPGRTLLTWTGRVTEMSGLVKAAPAALVRATAEKVISDGWRALRAQIEPPLPPPAGGDRGVG